MFEKSLPTASVVALALLLIFAAGSCDKSTDTGGDVSRPGTVVVGSTGESNPENPPPARDNTPDTPPAEEIDAYPGLAELQAIEAEERAVAERAREETPLVEDILEQLEGAGEEQRYELLTGDLVEMDTVAQRVALPKLKELMTSDPSSRVRAAAAELVYKLDESPEAIEVLCDCLGDEDHVVREYAAWSLHHNGEDNPATLAPLAGALHDENKYVREKAAAAISARHGIGQPVIPDMIDALNNDDHWAVRSSCLYFLARVEQDEVDLFPIICTAVDDEVMEVRRAVFSALTSMEDDYRLIPFVLDTIEGDNNELIAFALETAEKLKVEEAVPYAENLVDSEDNDVARAARRVLTYVRDRRIPGR